MEILKHYVLGHFSSWKEFCGFFVGKRFWSFSVFCYKKGKNCRFCEIGKRRARPIPRTSQRRGRTEIGLKGPFSAQLALFWPSPRLLSLRLDYPEWITAKKSDEKIDFGAWAEGSTFYDYLGGISNPAVSSWNKSGLRRHSLKALGAKSRISGFDTAGNPQTLRTKKIWRREKPQILSCFPEVPCYNQMWSWKKEGISNHQYLCPLLKCTASRIVRFQNCGPGMARISPARSTEVRRIPASRIAENQFRINNPNRNPSMFKAAVATALLGVQNRPGSA